MESATQRRPYWLPFLLVLPALVALAAAGCSSERDARATEPSIDHATPAMSHGGAHVPENAELAQNIAAIRALTARYEDLAAAQDAGWNVLVPNCRDNQPVGGMGWHYLNPAYVGPDPQVLEPQVLIYEPQQNGRMRFVGVEYLIPFSIRPSTDVPPTLLGQEFLQNFNDNVWMLHVWVGRQNPAGLFATWNPNVSCQYAQ